MKIGRLSAAIGGDHRYMDYLTVWYDPKSDVVTVTVSTTAPVGGMDGPGGVHDPDESFRESTKPGPSASDVLRILKKAIVNDDFNFKRYGKPSKNFQWLNVGNGLNVELCNRALKNARNLRESSNDRTRMIKSSNIQRLARTLGIPAVGIDNVYSSNDTLRWSKRGGYAGEKVIDRVRAKAQELGWTAGNSSLSGSPDGSRTGSGNELVSPEGHVLSCNASYGVTPASNSFYITLKLADTLAKEGKTMKITVSQLRNIINEVAGEQGVIHLKPGETYNDPEGNKITVRDIKVVLHWRGSTQTIVSYEFETVDGEKGSESNSAETLGKMLFGH